MNSRRPKYVTLSNGIMVPVNYDKKNHPYTFEVREIEKKNGMMHLKIGFRGKEYELSCKPEEFDDPKCIEHIKEIVEKMAS